jgi:hypothetical protein
MYKLFFGFIFLVSFSASSQSNAEKNIHQVLMQQAIAWNRGDVENFMEGYWKNDSLIFIGKNGVTHGWQRTLDNYKKKYPDATAMGKLSFDIIAVKKLSSKYYYVVGKWMLKRTIGDLSGHFDLLFEKVKGKWFIIADHSS